MPRSLSENREATAKKRYRPFFSLIFVKYSQYSPQMTKKNDSKSLSLARVPILGQAPRVFLILALLMAFSVQGGTLAEYKFDTEAQAQDFRSLIAKMRCLVCQNESLAASDADLAHDLRNEIYDMVRAGKSHDQVIDFMVARYGDFVLYDPPVKPSTYPIWFGPLILFLIGAALLIRAVRRKKQSREAPLSAAEERRLASLLKSSPESQDAKK